MDTQSVAEIMERDIERLRIARPSLASRIERAEHILVTQLSVTNGSRPIKVRIGADGTLSYRVRSGSKLTRAYAVNPASWTCECPDHKRRQAACKHAMACWILERAYRSSPAASSGAGECSGCGGRRSHAGRELIELHEDNHDNLTYFDGDMLCRECADNAGVSTRGRGYDEGTRPASRLRCCEVSRRRDNQESGKERRSTCRKQSWWRPL